MEEKPNYFAVIPADVRYDKKLTDKAKLLYGEIVALSNKNGYCYATNSYFAELYGTTTLTISRLIKNLIDNGYITSEIVYEENSKEIKARYLTICNRGIIKNDNRGIIKNDNTYYQKRYEGIIKNDKDNNTSIIIHNNNKRESIREKNQAPTFDEVDAYIKDKHLSVNPNKFFDYFTESNWVDSKGNKVKNWKQKLLTWNSFNQPQVETTATSTNRYHDIEDKYGDMEQYYTIGGAYSDD